MEGLLHLSGLAAAVCIAYVGLDQLHWDDRKFETNLKEAEDEIAKSLLRYGLQRGPINPKDSCDLFPFLVRLRLFALCRVGGINVKMGWWYRLMHHVHAQLHVQLLPYFRKRRDRTVIKWMALVSIAIFLYISALATWGMQSFPFTCETHRVFSLDVCNYVWSVPTETTVPYFYTILAVIFVWVCLTGYFSQRLQNIKEECARIDSKVNAYADKMRNFLEAKIPPNPIPAGTSMPTHVAPGALEHPPQVPIQNPPD